MIDSVSCFTCSLIRLTGCCGSGVKVGIGAGVSRLPCSGEKALLICSPKLRLSTLPTTNSVMASGVYHC
ncbi:Uncharacterised protein [Acinetobacter baumannii]|nr:Uncharacterised protein [Acinetobacter baumannii]